MSIGQYPALPLEPAEALRMVRKPNPKYWTGARNRAILGVLWRCGLRNSELRNLDMEHIVRNGTRSLRVTKPKGFLSGKDTRTCGLDEQTWELIEHWLTFRGNGPGPLFCTGKGTRLDDRNLRRMIAAIARQAGITRRVHPHCFRHTFAKDLYDEHVGIVHISAALGHSKIETTAGYLKHIGCAEVVTLTASREWTI